jgi:hypothetical protein
MSSAKHLPAGAMLFAPVQLAEKFPGHRLVARSDDPRSFQDHLNGDAMERIEYLQLTNLEADPSPLMKWEAVLPIDLVMKKPGLEFPRLYAYARLLDRGPVRVSIPAAEGLEKAVKLAASLHFSVKIIPGQPESDQTLQLIRLADFYLTNQTIAQPIEFFHSLFFAMVNNSDTTLWEILEKEPTRFCFVTDDGQTAAREPLQIPVLEILPEKEAEIISGRTETIHLQSQAVMNRHKTCAACTYFQWCRGFFKYPAADYSCTAVFPLFEHLFTAAAELKQDMSASAPGVQS